MCVLSKSVLAVCLLVFAGLVHAFDSIQLVGLFKDRAVVMLDDERVMFTAGKRNEDHQRVYLVSADSEAAVMIVDGVQAVYRPESIVHAPLGEPDRVEAAIWRDISGLYQTVGSINGQLYSMLVDTGASQIAMNEHHARRLGIDYRISGTPVRVATASSEETVYKVNLAKVRVGELELRDVGALVLPGNHPDIVLLGMSFLNRVELRNSGDRLVLRKKF